MAKFKIEDINIKLKKFENKYPIIDELLEFCSENNCSDLYLKVDDFPYINRYGKIIKIPSKVLTQKDWNDFAKEAITSERNAKYVREKMLDFTYTLLIKEDSQFYDKYEYRYRVSAGFSSDKNIATFRMISPNLPSFKYIKYPEIVKKSLKEAFSRKSGIIFICGETGSGKTTTLAASINDFSKKNKPLDNSMIITLEDPVEYIYESTNSARIVQKELGIDFKTFPLGVKQALREHPTHILCGEIRDKEGISTCIEAARTGHKVMTTFHTGSVSGTISRLYNYLSVNGENIMYDLIANIDLIICQRLEANGNTFSLDTQYLIFTDEIKKYLQNIIMQNKNIPIEIDKLFNNKSIIDNKIAKDWS